MPKLLITGNKESLRKLLELCGVKAENSGGSSATSSSAESKDENYVYYKGALLDIESLMQRLERSEKSRTALEKNMQELTDQLSKLFVFLLLVSWLSIFPNFLQSF